MVILPLIKEALARTRKKSGSTPKKRTPKLMRIPTT